MHRFEKSFIVFVVIAGIFLLASACLLIFTGEEEKPEEYPVVRDSIDIGSRSAVAWKKLRSSYRVDSLERLLQLGAEQYDIATAAFLIFKDIDPALEIDASLCEVDRIASVILKKMPKRVSPERALTLINAHLFDVMEFRHADLIHKFGILSSVLENREGNCLGLSTLYLAVGRRLGLPLFLVKVPHHALVRYCDGRTTINIETQEKGAFYDDASVRKDFKIRDEPGFLNNLTAKEEVAHLLIQRGIEWQERDEYDRAIADFTLSTELVPDLYHAYEWRASTWLFKKDYEKAIQDYTQILELALPFERLIFNYYYRGSSYFFSANFDAAIADFSSAIREASRFKDAYAMRGAAWLHKKEYRKVILDYNKVLELDPDYGLAYARIGEAYQMLGIDSQAIPYIEKAESLGVAFNEVIQAGQ